MLWIFLIKIAELRDLTVKINNLFKFSTQTPQHTIW